MHRMSTLRIVVCLLPSATVGLAAGAALRALMPNRPILRALTGIVVMPAVGYAGGLITEHMVRWTEGRIA